MQRNGWKAARLPACNTTGAIIAAIAMTALPNKPTMPGTAASSQENRERRETPRHPFIASAEETDVASGTRLQHVFPT